MKMKITFGGNSSDMITNGTGVNPNATESIKNETLITGTTENAATS